MKFSELKNSLDIAIEGKPQKVFVPSFDKTSDFNEEFPFGKINVNNPEFPYWNEFANFYFYKKGQIVDRIDFSQLDVSLLDYFNKPKYTLIRQELNTQYNDHLFLFKDKNLIYYVVVSGEDLVCNLKIYGKFDANKLIKEFEQFKRKIDDSKFEIGMIKTSEFGFDVTWFEIDKPTIDVKLNYGAEFAEKHYPNIINKLNGKKSGLLLFSSAPGAGKSFFIKHLASIVDRKFIYLSESVLSQGLDSPALIEILTMNRGCVVVIEDAEKFLISREENPNSFVSNLLNASDGILGDILDFRLILTHNMTKLEAIDPAVTRKGRMLYQHEFKPLSVVDANKKLEQLGVDYRTTKPMSLAEIYNLDDNGVEEKVERTIGFR